MLSEEEAFDLVEENEEKRAKYRKMNELRRKANNGTITKEELKFLCDTAFGEGTEEAKKIYDVMIASGKVKDKDENEMEL